MAARQRESEAELAEWEWRDIPLKQFLWPHFLLLYFNAVKTKTKTILIIGEVCNAIPMTILEGIN